jgi:hypothetical protein
MVVRPPAVSRWRRPPRPPAVSWLPIVRVFVLAFERLIVSSSL